MEPALLAAMPMWLWQSGSLITLNLACPKPTEMSPFHTQCLAYTRGSGGQQALSSDPCPSSKNVIPQVYSLLPQIDQLCPPANSSNPEGKIGQSDVESVFQLVTLPPNTILMSSFAPNYQAGCPVLSATRAIKQKTVSRENVTQHKKTARLCSTTAVAVI